MQGIDNNKPNYGYEYDPCKDDNNLKADNDSKNEEDTNDDTQRDVGDNIDYGPIKDTADNGHWEF